MTIRPTHKRDTDIGTTPRRMALLAAVATSLVAWVPLASPASATTACTVVYSGDTLVEFGSATRLAADVSGAAGAGANRAVTFILADGSGATLHYGAVSDLAGRATTTVAAPEGVYGVVATVAADPLRSACASPAEPDDALLAVTTTGARLGGSGTIATATGTVRFGLRLRTLDDGTLSGRLQLRIYPPNPARPLSFRAITMEYPPTPAIDACRADVVGTGTLDGQAGYTYAVTALDSGRKATDYFSLMLTAPDRAVVYSSDALQPLVKGRITAHPPNPALPSDPCRSTVT